MQVESNRIELNWLCDRSMCRFVDLSICRPVPRLFVDCVGNSSGKGQTHARIYAPCHMLPAGCCCSCQLRAQLSNVPINNMRKFPTHSLSSSISLCLFLVSCSAQQATQPTVVAPAVASTAGVQRFRITPHDLQILEGTDTLLRCEVDARAGKVQWTKDGFALGFSAVIPGFPRYSVLVDAPHGTYNLQIKNATLEDDAEYQCQVGPAAGNPAIRANAKLSIVAAPSSIYIDGYSRNAKVEVIEKQNLTLQCITENANPAAEIVWFQGDAQVTLGKWRKNEMTG